MAGSSSPIALLFLLLFFAVTTLMQQTGLAPREQNGVSLYPHYPFDVQGDATSELHAQPNSSDLVRCTFWNTCFFTVSDCPQYGYVKAGRECFNERTKPSGQCYQFNNFASVSVDTQDCNIEIYQDDNCTSLLQGSDTRFNYWERFCWKKLTSDPARKRSKLRYQYFLTSGSWKVDCGKGGQFAKPQDCPRMIQCEDGCVVKQTQNKTRPKP